MPCFYIRNASFIALFRVDEELDGLVVAELIPNENLSSYIKRRGLNNFSIKRVYEDEQVAIEDFQGKNKVHDELLATADDVDIQELLRNVNPAEKVKLATHDNLMQSSMHHFKLRTREVVEVYHFEGIEAVNSLRDVMTNYVS